MGTAWVSLLSFICYLFHNVKRLFIKIDERVVERYNALHAPSVGSRRMGHEDNEGEIRCQ